MATRRAPYTYDALRGENNTDSLLNQAFFGNSGKKSGRMRRLRGYHLIGEGKALSRRGYKPFHALQPNGSNPIQGMTMDEWESDRDLYIVSGAKLLRLNGAAWDDVTGTAVIATGQDTHIRWTEFTDANSNWKIGSDGVNTPFLVKRGSNAALLSEVSPQPLPWEFSTAQPVDVIEFHGYILALLKYALHYTQYGTFDFENGGIIETQRRGIGVGMTMHAKDIVLLFYETGVYALQFNPFEGAAFRAVPIAGAEGCVSKDSIYTKDGWTYWAGLKGIYRVGDPARGAKKITEESQTHWDGLDQARRYQIRHVQRGSPWNEAIFLTSEAGSTKHNSALVWNDRIGALSIFPRSPTAATMEFNCACLWRDTDLIDRTLVGGYDGIIYEAWGTSSADSGTSDNGSPIATELETGFITYGFPGVADLREVFIDGEASESNLFQVQGEVLGSTQVFSTEFTMGTSGEVLGAFMLGEDYLVSSVISQGDFEMPISGRAHKIRLTRTGTETPHIITALTMSHIIKRLRPQ